MACTDEQQQTFKHYCRVCKKGFMCGRALGGHMRAHGIGDENGKLDDDDDDQASYWEEKLGGSERTNNKRMYQLRTNPNRLKSCRICKNCGKEFLSWKSFLEHGKCSSDDASESLLSPPESEGEDDKSRRGAGWSKRKRSLRTQVCNLSSNYLPSEDDDLLLARCLVQLANTIVDPPMMEPEESSTSASQEDRRYSTSFFGPRSPFDKSKGPSSPNPKGLFECKACKKVFNSHQALGGHRASHKKVKGCYAAKQDQSNQTTIAVDDVITQEDQIFPSKSTSSFQFEHAPTLVGAARRKAKVHECSICHRVFASGQALGGHKRCHWVTSNEPEPSTLSKFHFQGPTELPHRHQEPKMIDKSDTLDLNVPAWAHELGVRREPHNPLSFDVSTDMILDTCPVGQSDQQHKFENKKDNDNDNIMIDKSNIGGNNSSSAPHNADDEADSKMKLAKLDDLKGVEAGVNSSQWLQVGIGPSSEVANGKS